MTGIRVIRSERTPEANYDVLETEAGPDEIYVDGFVGQSLSAVVVRTNLYSSIDAKHEGEMVVEQRLIKLRLVMPTHAFIDMCVKTLSSFRENETALKVALDQHRDVILKRLSAVEPAKAKKET